MAGRLKVFRTPIGFHDAYVAATSRKAALAAWGADVDLFARGAAEQVDDPALTAAPLAAPGEVIKVTRGSVDAHLAALPPAKDASKSRRRDRGKPGKPRPPRPSRSALEAAEQRLAQHRQDLEAEIEDLEAQRSRINRQIARVRQAGKAKAETLEADVRTQRSAYEARVDAWRDA